MKEQLAFAVEVLEAGGEFQPEFWAIKDGVEVVTALFHYKDATDKEVALSVGQALAVYYEADEFVFIAEAWVTTPKPDEEYCPPSESDQKIEALIVTHGTTERTKVDVYEIVRAEGTVRLEQRLPQYDGAGGRFTKFMDMVGHKSKEQAEVLLAWVTMTMGDIVQISIPKEQSSASLELN